MLISFVIPLYQVKKKDFLRCLDSIYRQATQYDKFEVICVDDCSPDADTSIYVSEYKINGIAPSNLFLVRHDINKRQGGARNTAIKVSNGDFVFLIDQDDFLYDGAIEIMMSSIEKYKGVDIIMFDSALSDENGNMVKKGHYVHVNRTSLMTGNEFLCTQEIPWTPWHYLYRRNFLLDNNYKFEENVRFEDVDFVMRCTVNAAKMVFVPNTVIVHSISSYQTSTVGNSVEKIYDLVKVSYRTGLVGLEEYNKGNKKGASVIISHHHFGYMAAVKSYIWRLLYASMKECTKKYPPIIIGKASVLIRFMGNFPGMFSFLMVCMFPILSLLYWAYSKVKLVKN